MNPVVDNLILAAASIVATGPSPSPSHSVLKAPPPDAYQTIGAIAAIVLALAAGVLAYRVIRGGRGL
jgi:hypothetical protein